jgi:hypothetical protein
MEGMNRRRDNKEGYIGGRLLRPLKLNLSQVNWISSLIVQSPSWTLFKVNAGKITERYQF